LKSFVFLFRQVLLLTRFKLSLSVAFSTLAAGYIAVGFTNDVRRVLISGGIFLLACGASALNQIQERNFDGKMQRTHLRPIPNGTLSLPDARTIALMFLFSGLFILLFFASLISFGLGVFSLLWYNGLYTGLKRKTAYAMIPGTLTGVIPVMIGWQAAGGDLLNLSFIFICMFMVSWQLPHFILLMLRFKDDYQKAGFPALTDRYSVQTVKDIIISATTGMLVICGGMIYFGVFHLEIIKIVIGILCVSFFVIFSISLYRKSENYRMAFISINIFMLLVLVLLLADKIAGNYYFVL
jgi:heme o synthase